MDLFVEPRLGLGNRCRAFFSGLKRAGEAGQKLRIYWRPNGLCPAPITALWLPDEHWSEATEKELLAAGNAIRTYYWFPDTSMLTKVAGNIASLRVHPAVKKVADDAISAGLERAAAVAIRLTRCVHPVTQRTATFVKFTDRIDQLLKAGTVDKLLCCTDGPALKSALRARYGDRVLPFEQRAYGVTAAMVQDSLAFFYAASRCAVYLAPNASSMGEVPWAINPNLNVEWIGG